MDQHLLDTVDVVHDAVDEVPGPLLGVKPQRKPLQSREQRSSDVVDESLPRRVHEEGPQIVHDRARHQDHHIGGDRDVEDEVLAPALDQAGSGNLYGLVLQDTVDDHLQGPRLSERQDSTGQSEQGPADEQEPISAKERPKAVDGRKHRATGLHPRK